MNPNREILVSLLILIALLLTWGGLSASSDSPMPENKVPESVESNARRLMNDLRKQGFEVERGYFRLITEKDCPVSFAEMASCYGNNPAAPYVTFSIPPWPEEFIDPATDTAFGINLDGYSTTYRLDPREAIVILGVLPPRAKYFGLQSYRFTRQGDFDTASPTYQFMLDKPPLLRLFFSKVPQHTERVLSLSSLSDAINHVVIERQSSAAFDQQRYFIITPDQFMDNAVREAFDRILVEDEDIFTEPIPANVIVGLDEPADDFLTLLRYALPEDGGDLGDPSDLWRKDLPLAVLRVRDIQPQRPPQPYPAFTDPEARQIASELDLKDDLDNLVKAVSQRWGQPEAALAATMLLPVQPGPINMVGPKCIPIGMNCLADTQDTSYQYSYPLPVTDDGIYAVVGTLGTHTGNATYVGLGLTATPPLLGFDNRSDADLENSASSYGPGVNNVDKFFVYYFGRNCTGLQDLTEGFCVDISETDIPACADPTWATCQQLSISLRDYMPEGTQRGPDDNYILPARVILLQRP